MSATTTTARKGRPFIDTCTKACSRFPYCLAIGDKSKCPAVFNEASGARADAAGAAWRSGTICQATWGVGMRMCKDVREDMSPDEFVAKLVKVDPILRMVYGDSLPGEAAR